MSTTASDMLTDDDKYQARETIRQLRSEYEEIIQKLRDEVVEWKRLAEKRESKIKDLEDVYWQQHVIATDRLSNNHGRAMIAVKAMNLVRDALESQAPVHVIATSIADIVMQYDDAMHAHDAAMLEKRHAIEREALEERHKKEREKLSKKTVEATKTTAPAPSTPEQKPCESTGKKLP